MRRTGQLKGTEYMKKETGLSATLFQIRYALAFPQELECLTSMFSFPLHRERDLYPSATDKNKPLPVTWVGKKS